MGISLNKRANVGGLEGLGLHVTWLCQQKITFFIPNIKIHRHPLMFPFITEAAKGHRAAVKTLKASSAFTPIKLNTETGASIGYF